MVSLASWLRPRTETLTESAAQYFSSKIELQQAVKPPLRAFFKGLASAAEQENVEPLNAILKDWFAQRTARIADQPVSLLPVLGTLKQVLWADLKQAGLPAEDTLDFAQRLDTLLVKAAEYVARSDAVDLLDELSHRAISPHLSTNVDRRDSRQDFISVMAHELKTPLTVIEGYMNMLKLELAGVDNPRAVLMLGGLQGGIQRLHGLIEDMINVSLIETGLLDLEVQPVWLRRVFDIAEFEARGAVEQRNLTLTVKRDTLPSKPTSGDPERLLHAFQKIIGNAIKYTPDSGHITVFGREVNHFVEIVVQDNGIGIAPENLDRIFEKTPMIDDVSLHSSGKVKYKGGGAGLGLVIAKGIIEAHGGSIWVESPGYDEVNFPGSSFHIWIPMHDIAIGEGMSPLVASAATAISKEASVESLPSSEHHAVASRTAEAAPDSTGKNLLALAGENQPQETSTLTSAGVKDTGSQKAGE